MSVKTFIFIWSLVASFAVVVDRNSCGVKAAASVAADRWPKGSSNGTTPSKRTQDVTKVQVEDLDEASPGCVRLRELRLCPHGPRTARYPNGVGHGSEPEATVFLRRVSSLMLDPTCSRSLTPFLCAALTPPCSAGGDNSPEALPPCRSLCLRALGGCGMALKTRQILWPPEWTCGSFPEEGLCLDMSFHHSAGPSPGYSDRGLTLYWSQAHVIQSRGSLEPPPSSAVDEELQALHEIASSKDSSTNARRQAIQINPGDPRFFRGWVDVQGQGKRNDYCRILGTGPRDRFLSCAINGVEVETSYFSKRGFDVGHPRTWFMRDMDGDGRDDYCRCVGSDTHSQMICMKAGEKGFYGGVMQPGSEYTFRIPDSSAFTIYCRRNNRIFSIGNRTNT